MCSETDDVVEPFFRSDRRIPTEDIHFELGAGEGSFPYCEVNLYSSYMSGVFLNPL
jgi:hypothetical protein